MFLTVTFCIGVNNPQTEHFSIERIKFNIIVLNMVQLNKLEPEILHKNHVLKGTFGGL